MCYCWSYYTPVQFHFSNFKHDSQSFTVALWTSTYYSAVGGFWHLMRTKCCHCSNLSFLIPSSNVLIMSKNYIKIPANSLLNNHRMISTTDRLPSNLTLQHLICVADIKVLCAFLAVVQKWKLAIMARTRSAQNLDHACVRVDASVLPSTDMVKALSLTSPILSLYSNSRLRLRHSSLSPTGYRTQSYWWKKYVVPT
jgi:hypothetical protein